MDKMAFFWFLKEANEFHFILRPAQSLEVSLSKCYNNIPHIWENMPGDGAALSGLVSQSQG